MTTTQVKGRSVPQTNGTKPDDTHAKIEARIAELKKHQQELADQHRIVTVVIGEMEMLLKEKEETA